MARARDPWNRMTPPQISVRVVNSKYILECLRWTDGASRNNDPFRYILVLRAIVSIQVTGNTNTTTVDRAASWEAHWWEKAFHGRQVRVAQDKTQKDSPKCFDYRFLLWFPVVAAK